MRPKSAAYWSGSIPSPRVAWGDERGGEDGEGDIDDEDEFTLADLAAETLLPPEDLEEWVGLLSGAKRQAIFYGPPGTGKTFVAQRIAKHMAGPQGRREGGAVPPVLFVRGLHRRAPSVGRPGELPIRVRPGLFLQFCETAGRWPDATFVLIIDEINRADLGSVLGELMMLLEYRGESIQLPYSQRPFSVPSNVVVLATMNTADRSLALVDRRFGADFTRSSSLPTGRCSRRT